MSILDHPLVRHSGTGSGAALVEACGHVFAGSLVSDARSVVDRNDREERAASAVRAFLDAMR